MYCNIGSEVTKISGISEYQQNTLFFFILLPSPMGRRIEEVAGPEGLGVRSASIFLIPQQYS